MSVIPYLLRELRLKELDILGEVKGVLSTLSDHVGIEYFIRLFKDLYQVHFINSSIQGALKNFH